MSFWQILIRTRELFPLTWMGVLASVGLVLLATWVAMARMDIILWYFVWTMFGLLTSQMALVLFYTRRHKKKMKALSWEQDITTETGRAFELHSPIRYWPLVNIESVLLDGEEKIQVSEESQVTFKRRTRLTAAVIQTTVFDRFGLSAVTFRATQHRTITVLPHLGKFREMAMPKLFANGEERYDFSGAFEGDRTDQKRYDPSEAARFIHWKQFARSGQLMTKVQERAVSEAKHYLFYVVPSKERQGDDDAAFALARHWVLMAEKEKLPFTLVIHGHTEHTPHPQAAMRRLARRDLRSQDSVEPRIKQTENNIKLMGVVTLVFASTEALSDARMNDLRPTRPVLLAGDDVRFATSSHWQSIWKRLLWAESDEREALDEATRVRWFKQHPHTFIFDRKAGKELLMGEAKKHVGVRRHKAA